MIKLFFFLVSLLPFSSMATVVCMTSENASLYECIENEDKDTYCQKKYGKEYRGYYPSNSCSPDLASHLRGDKNVDVDLNDIGAICVSYEAGIENNCELYDFDIAYQHCQEDYGLTLVPFIKSNSCNDDFAIKARGEVHPSKLTQGLEEDFTLLEKLMQMIDKDQKQDGFFMTSAEYISKDLDFHSREVKYLMAKMNEAKDLLLQRSQLNARFGGKYSKDFVNYANRYLSLLGRLYTFYAKVAHYNHYVLKTYSFKNLSYLNLKLKKDYALEILNKINFKSKHVSTRIIEFIPSEMEKMQYEQIAIHTPVSKTDYSKYLGFLGVKENLTNLWALQKLSYDHIEDAKVNSCVQGILSFRPEHGSMRKSTYYKELEEYDYFEERYKNHLDAIKQKLLQVVFLSASEISQIYKGFYKDSLEYREFLKFFFNSEEEFFEVIDNSTFMVLKQQFESLNAYLKSHLSSVVFIGDGIQSVQNITKRIIEESYAFNVKQFVELSVGQDYFAPTSIQQQMREYYNRELNKSQYKTRYINSLKVGLEQVLSDYNNDHIYIDKTREKMINNAYTDAFIGAHPARLKYQLENDIEIELKDYYQPINVEMLSAFFQLKMQEDIFYQNTIAADKDKLKIVNEFFKVAQDDYVERSKNVYGKLTDKLLGKPHEMLKYLYADNKKKLEVMLWNSFQKAAAHIQKKYPFEFGFKPLQFNTAVADKTRVHISTVALADDNKEQAVIATFSDRELQLLLTSSEPVMVTAQSDRSNMLIGNYNLTQLLIEKRYKEDHFFYSNKGLPVRVDKQGNVVTSNDTLYKVEAEVLKMLSEYKIQTDHKEADSDEMIQYNQNFVIKENSLFVQYFLRVLNVNKSAIVSSESDLSLLVNKIVDDIYASTPLLRQEVPVRMKKVFKSIRHGNISRNEVVNLALLEALALKHYSMDDYILDYNAAVRNIENVIDRGLEKTAGLLKDFCDVKFTNYKSDNAFKKIFKTSSHLREKILLSQHLSDESRMQISELEQNIAKDIRTTVERLNEDYLQKTINYLGYIAIASAILSVVIGTGGAGLPAALGMYLTKFLVFEFFVSLPLLSLSAMIKMNKEFIIVPHQLRFHQSLVHSQLSTDAEVGSWSSYNKQYDTNKFEKKMAIIESAFTLGYGGMVYHNLRSVLGFKAVNLVNKNTGIKLHKFSKPVVTPSISKSFADLRKKHGLIRGAYKRSKLALKNAARFLPKYQPLTEKQIKYSLLRKAFTTKASQLKLSAQPWALIKPIQKLKNEQVLLIKDLERYNELASTALRSGRVNNNSMSALTSLQRDFSKKWYALKTFFRLSSKGELENFRNMYGKLVSQMNRRHILKVQAEVAKLDNYIAKLKIVQKNSGSQLVNDNFNEFQKLLTHEELLYFIQNIAKKSKDSNLKLFKSLAKDYKHIIEHLKPMENLYLGTGIKFNPATIYVPLERSLSEESLTVSEDLVRYYEDIESLYKSDSQIDQMDKKEIESHLLSLFNIDSKGNKVFKDN